MNSQVIHRVLAAATIFAFNCRSDETVPVAQPVAAAATAEVTVASAPVHSGANPDCPYLDGANLVGEVGKRKLALLVGVDEYLYTIDDKSINLRGAVHDATRMRDVLIDNYSFPKENVCLLTNADATRERFESIWTGHLGRADGDGVVFFFAGHGGQAIDTDGSLDETEGRDETLLFHNSRSIDASTPPDLVDDELNQMLADLYARTENITVILDACNTGSTTRSLTEGVKTRGVSTKLKLDAATDGKRFAPARFPKMVYIGAAADGSKALEMYGSGVLTNALLAALGKENRAIPWSSLTRSVPRLVADQHSRQLVQFSGDLTRMVFDSSQLRRPLSWDVDHAEFGIVRFRGPPLPGWSVGALVDVYAGDTSASDISNASAKRKASVQLTEVHRISASGVVREGNADAIGDTDFGILVTPGHNAVQLKVRIEDPDVRLKVAAELHENTQLAAQISLDDDAPDMSLRRMDDGALEIVDAQGVHRNRVPSSGIQEDWEMALSALAGHATQLAIMRVPDGQGAAYADNETLRVTLRAEGVPQLACPLGGVELVPNHLGYEVPLCSTVVLDVELARKFDHEMHLAALYLGGDGAVTPYELTTIPKGQTGPASLMPLMLGPPLDVADYIFVVGTPEHIDWGSLASGPRYVSPDDATPLQRWFADITSSTRSADSAADYGPSPVAFTQTWLQVGIVGSHDWTEDEMQDRFVCRKRRRIYRGECPKASHPPEP